MLCREVKVTSQDEHLGKDFEKEKGRFLAAEGPEK
jgi:hypothetical protein